MVNIQKIRPGVWQLEESYRVYCTLVLGEAGAVLFDTGLGKQDLSSFVANQGKADCTVVCSHGHYDHVGGLCRFPSARLNRKDHALVEENTEGTAPSSPWSRETPSTWAPSMRKPCPWQDTHTAPWAS